MNLHNCNRSDVVLVRHGHAPGLEQNDDIPAVVISCDTINDNLETVIVCPLIESKQPSESRVGAIFVPKEVLGLENNHFVLCLQILTVFQEQIINRIGSLPDSLMSSVELGVKTVLHLD